MGFARQIAGTLGLRTSSCGCGESELDKLLQGHTKGIGDVTHDIKTYADLALFDGPEMGLVGTGNIGQSSLREVALLAETPHLLPEGFSA